MILRIRRLNPALPLPAYQTPGAAAVDLRGVPKLPRSKSYNLIGLRFHYLVVTEHAGKQGGRRPPLWRCLCDCGKLCDAVASALISGAKKSCGCMKAKLVSQRVGRHWEASSREHAIWCGMRQRCMNPKCPEYKFYGARGIRICDRWSVFENFLADMGRRPGPSHSLDRIDNDGNYEPGNVRWATKVEQCNNRRTSRRLRLGEREMTIAQWARELGFPAAMIQCRLKRGWSDERALTESRSTVRGGKR